MFYNVFSFLTLCCRDTIEIGFKSKLIQRFGTVFNVFLNFMKIKCKSFCYVEKKDPGRMSGSSQTYLLNSRYNIEPSTKVTRRFKNMRFF